MRTQVAVLSVAAAIVLSGCNRSTVEAKSPGATNDSARPVTFYAPKKGPVVLPLGTTLQVRMDEAVSTVRARTGARFAATLSTPVTVDGKIALPAGTRIEGLVRNAKTSSRKTGSAALSLVLSSIEVNGRELAVTTTSQSRVSKKQVSIPAETVMTFRLQQPLIIG